MKPFLIAILFFCSFKPANAFTLISSSIRQGWDETTLTFNVNETSCTALGISASTLNSAIDGAIELWNKSPTSKLKLARGSTVTSTSATNPPTIYCSNTAQSNTTAGIGGVSTSGGVPVQGYLYLNGDSTMDAYFNNLTSTQQQVVMAHEMGHVLGLGHSENEYAMMYYDISSKETLNLSQDDIDGLTWLNPRDELKSGIMGCATIQEIGKRMPPTDGTGSIIINWILVMWIAYLASRRRNQNAANADALI
jgi:hypothetical protein